MASVRKLLSGLSKRKHDTRSPAKKPRPADGSGPASNVPLAPPAQHSAVTSNDSIPIERTERYGLLPLNDYTAYYTRDAETVYYDIDIVAVHGLNGDAYSTWTDKVSGKLWLKDFLPKDLPGARVFSFGYPSEVAFTKTTGKLEDWSRALLEGLKASRSREQDSQRSIVFVVHSLGGLVVKKAMIIAHLDEHDYSGLRQCVRGILFMSTPHRGSDITAFPKVLCNIGNLGLTATSRISGRMRTDLIQLLETNSPELTKIATDFRNQVEGIKIISFTEEKLIPPFTNLIVDNHSSILGIPGETVVPMIDYDHRTICQYQTPKTNGYMLVLNHIKSTQLGNPRNFDRKKFLSSLFYDEIDFRQLDVKEPLSDTCDWLFQQPAYTTWIQRTATAENYGMLWIKGKPGSGKSTLMKHIIHRIQSHKGDYVLAFYFFHARGTSLENTSLGLYRTLLYRLLKTIDKWPLQVIDTVTEKFEMNPAPIWHLQELQNILETVLTSDGSRNRPTYLLIDALDECQGSEVNRGTEAWQDVVDFLTKVSQKAFQRGANLNICVSRRHFPNIPTQKLEITTESFNGLDILRFIQAKLSPSFPNNSDIHQELIRRSGGIFLWVMLSINLVNQAAVDGESEQEILELIRSEIPKGLSETFRHSFAKVPAKQRKNTILLLQLLLFAQRPLTPQELQYAITFDVPRKFMKDCRLAPNFVRSAQLEQRMRHLSAGLVEISSVQTYQGRSDGERLSVDYVDQRVQFIHESVREYLLEESGWTVFDPGFKQELLLGASHEMIMNLCFNFINVNELEKESMRYADPQSTTQTFRWPEDEMTDLSDLRRSLTRIEVRKYLAEEYPFLEYSLMFCFTHAALADLHGKWQVPRIKEALTAPSPFFGRWMALQRLMVDHEERILKDNTPRHGFSTPLPAATTPLHAMAVLGLGQFLQALIQSGLDSVARNSEGKTPLHLASQGGHKAVLLCLLDSYPDVDVKDHEGRTPLHVAASAGETEICEILLDRGANIHLFGGKHNTGAFMLEDYNDTPLHLALRGGNSSTAIMLINRNANVNARRKVLSKWTSQVHSLITPLQLAVQQDMPEVVKLLLQKGADVNACGTVPPGCRRFYVHESGPALVESLKSASKESVHFLLKAGADVNAPDADGTTPLQYAVYSGSCDFVRDLIMHEANVETQTVGPAGSALIIACHGSSAERGCPGFPRLSLRDQPQDSIEGPEKEVYNSILTTLLQNSSSVNEDISQALATINSDKSCCDTPLQAAACSGNLFATQSLLQHGADIDLVGQRVRKTALRIAMGKGHSDVVNLLLARGADKSQGFVATEPSAFLEIIALGDQDRVLTCLQNGADPNARDSENHFALGVAAEGNHLSIVAMLLEHGADARAFGRLKYRTASATYAAVQSQNFDIMKVLTDQVASSLVDKREKRIWASKFLLHITKYSSGDRYESWLIFAKSLIVHGADVNYSEIGQPSILGAAVSNGNLKMMTLLLDHNARINQIFTDGESYSNVLAKAVASGKSATVQLLLDRGVNIVLYGGEALERCLTSDAPNLHIFQILHEAGARIDGGKYGNELVAACASGQIEVVRRVLQVKPGNINASGGTLHPSALHAACASANLEVVEFMIQQGADIHFGNMSQGSVLFAALDTWKCSPDVVRLLLKEGCDPNAFTENGAIPLVAAARDGFEEGLNLLLSHGANISAVDYMGQTALHHAAAHPFINNLPLLVQYGADFNAKDSQRRTALHMAVLSRNEDNVKYLVDVGVDINAVTSDAETCLHLACRSEAPEITQILVDGKAECSLIDSVGHTSLDWASLYQPCFSVFGAHSESYVPTPKDIRNSQLGRTILKVVSALQSQDYVSTTSDYYLLTQCFRLMGRTADFKIAISRLEIQEWRKGKNASERGDLGGKKSSTADSDEDAEEGTRTSFQVYCEDCRDTIKGDLFCCTVCFDVDFCSDCFHDRQLGRNWSQRMGKGGGHYEWRCKGHMFFKIPKGRNKRFRSIRDSDAAVAGKIKLPNSTLEPLFDDDYERAYEEANGKYSHLVEELDLSVLEDGESDDPEVNLETWLQRIFNEFKDLETGQVGT